MVNLKKFLLAVICSLTLTICSVNLVQASGPVHLKANQMGRWDVASQTFYAEGNVIIEFDGVELSGDQLVWDLEKHQVYLEGNVVMQQGDEQVIGDDLVYNTETEQGTFNKIRAELTGDNINGVVFVFGDQMQLDGNYYQIAQGKISSCDLTQPHYHVAVGSMEVYPGEKMIIRGVTYYEGRIPLFYWPYLAIPLNTNFDIDFFELPEVGYSAADGYYIKNRYNYYFNKKAYGTIFYDYYTRLGAGLGVHHNYENLLLGVGSLTLYSIPVAHRQHLNTQLEHEYKTENFIFKTKNAYYQDTVNHILQVRKSTQTSVNYRKEGLTVSGSLNYAEEEGTKESRDMTVAGSWNQRITPDLRLNIRSSLTEKNHKQVINNLAEATYSIKDHNFVLSFQQRYNPDILDPEATASWRSVNRLPEFTWRWQNPTFSGESFPGRFELGIGRFLEFPSETTSWRLAPRLELTSRSWRSNFGTTVTYNGGIAGYVYEEAMSQQTANTRITLQHNFLSNLRFSTTYNQQVVFGDTPFRFDKQTPRQTLTGQLSYTGRPLSGSVRTGYNFLTNKFDNLIPQVSWNNGKGLSLSSTLYYNLNTKTLGNLVTLFDYRASDNLLIKFGTRYQLGNQRLERIDGHLLFDLTEQITVKYDVIYDALKQSYTRGELVVAFDLHCRELSLAYNQVRQEFKMKYSINAFPKLPFGFSSTGGVSLFELTDLQEILGFD